jgi:hypothetical protein
MSIGDFTICPPHMFLELAEMAYENGNDRLYRVWIANYLRTTSSDASYLELYNSANMIEVST